MGWQLKNAGYYCIVDPDLPVEHDHAGDEETTLEFGGRWGRNYIPLFREDGSTIQFPLFCWAMLGNVLRNFIAPLADGRWRERWSTGIGFGVVEQLLIAKD